MRHERRNTEVRHIEFCPTEVVCKRSSIHATMMDISDEGAHFVSRDNVDTTVSRCKGTHYYYIKTPYGHALCEARTRWVACENGECDWGVQFTDVGYQDRDALRCLMESAFC